MPIRVVPDFYAWKTVVEVPVVEKCFPDIFKETTALYVGVRPLGWGGVPDPNSLATYLNRATANGGVIIGIEVWPRYCELLKQKKPPWLSSLVQADICDINTRLEIAPRRFPLVIWWHGPEHAKSEKDLEMGLANCEYLCAGRVLLGTPWSDHSQNATYGGFEGEPENPCEAHGFQPSPEWLSDHGYDVVCLNCRFPEEEDRSACGHIVAVKDVR